VNREEKVDVIRNLFDLVADEYDHVGVPLFAPIADGLVEAVGAVRGDKALDVGCRKGAASDPQLPPGSFGVVISSLVVFFLPEPVQAVSRWVRLLAPGGRIGLSTFGASSPEWEALEDLLMEYMPPQDPRTVGPQSPFASDAGMERLLAEAGAAGVRTTTRRVEFAFESFDQWVRFSRSVGQRAAWDRMSTEESARILREASRMFSEAAGPDESLPVWQVVRYTCGSAPP
jgi:SAM-dependent methyltransferase